MTNTILNSENCNIRIAETMSALTQILVNCESNIVETVILLGFHHPNDGGGGIFYLDCSKTQQDHNGGTVIAIEKDFPLVWNGNQQWFNPPLSTNQGCWVRQITEKPVNALWFGAKDESDVPISNAVDSTIPINKAIEYAHSSGVHYLYIPIGKFIIDGTINAIDHQVAEKRIKIVGDYMGHLPNVGTVLFRKENTNNQSPILSIDTTNGGLINYGSVPFLEISNLSFVGDTTIEHKGIYIRTVGLNNPSFKNLHFEYVQGTPLQIIQSSTVSRCEFMLVERMVVGMDWGTYNKPEGKSRPDNTICNGIWLEGVDSEFDVITIRKSQFSGGKFAPGILADVKGDVLSIEDTQIHQQSNSILTSIREFNLKGGYIERSENVAIKLLNNKSSRYRGVKSFRITGTLFSLLSDVLEMVDLEPIDSSTKGYIGEFYVLGETQGSYQNTNLIKEIGINSNIEVGRFSSNSGNINLFNQSVTSESKKENVTGMMSNIYSSKNEKFNKITYKINENPSPYYTTYIHFDEQQNEEFGLVFRRRVADGELYSPFVLGSSGGFKFRTYKASTGQEPAIFADYTGNVHIGKETSATEKLEVFGNVKANAFIAANTIYSDYVFEKYFTGKSEINKTYQLKSLEEVERYLKSNFHMEGYEPIKDVKRDSEGNFLINVSRQSSLNKEKIEEILLYLIIQNKEIKALKEENRSLLSKIENLEKMKK